MSPLKHVLAAWLLLAGCDEPKASPPSSRVVAVAAAPRSAHADEFCDARTAGQAPAFVLPSVEGPSELRARAQRGRRWINVWASWCTPCVQELPLLRKLEANFAREGIQASLVLLSVDSSEDAVTKFTAQHPDAKQTLRLDEARALEPWLKSMGLDASTTLPLHLFVDERGRVTCTRMGAIGESDGESIRKLLSG
jgi:thiol-disulfide isomerase/thioredoxin